MAEAMLEHVNLAVADPDESAAFYARLFDWKVRWQGADQDGRKAVHVGGENTYLSLYGPSAGEGVKQAEYGTPLHHIAVVVDDLDETEAKLKRADIETFGHGSYEPGRRFYFFDPNGIEFEVVSYR